MGARRRALIGAGVGASAGLLLVMWSAIATSGWAGLLPLLVFTLVLATLGFLLPLAAEGGRPFVLQQWVPLPAEEIRPHATRWYAASGWTLNANQPAALSFSRRPPPHPLLAVLLFLFGIVPGLLYLLLGNRTQTAAVVTSPVPDGTQLEIVVSSRDGGGQASAVAFFTSLHRLVDPPTPAALGRGRSRARPARAIIPATSGGESERWRRRPRRPTGPTASAWPKGCAYCC